MMLPKADPQIPVRTDQRLVWGQVAQHPHPRRYCVPLHSYTPSLGLLAYFVESTTFFPT